MIVGDAVDCAARKETMDKTLENYANEINSHLPNIKSGTLRFFGFWFGRPFDNIHRIRKAEARNDVLRLEFDECETLEISNPIYCEFSSNHFEIRKAQKVIWKWYYYGRPKTDENLYYYEFEVIGTEIRMTTNASWAEDHQVAQITELAVNCIISKSRGKRRIKWVIPKTEKIG